MFWYYQLLVSNIHFLGSGNRASRETIKYSYHIQKEISKGNYEMIWPSKDFSDYCFQEWIAWDEFHKYKTQNPLMNFRLVKFQITMKDHH